MAAAMFITGEYRRGLIRVSLTAAPRRGRLLAAKAVMIGAVSFTAGLIAAALAVAVGTRTLAGRGIPLWPVPVLTGARMVAGTAALLAGAVAVTAAIGAAADSTTRCPSAHCGLDPAKISFTGIYPAQAVAAVAGVLAIGDEYSTGMITLSLTAVPRRLTWLILPGRGFTPGHGHASLTAGADIRAAAGAVLYLTLIALLSLGVAAAVRDSAVAVGLVLGLLYLFPIAASLISDAAIARHLQQIGPLPAGLHAQATTGISSLPSPRGRGLASSPSGPPAPSSPARSP